MCKKCEMEKKALEEKGLQQVTTIVANVSPLLAKQLRSKKDSLEELEGIVSEDFNKEVERIKAELDKKYEEPYVKLYDEVENLQRTILVQSGLNEAVVQAELESGRIQYAIDVQNLEIQKKEIIKIQKAYRPQGVH
jgi:hypothetical protein